MSTSIGFISAPIDTYAAGQDPATGDAELAAKAIKALRDTPLKCRNFEWHAPEHLNFTVRFQGQVLKDVDIDKAKKSFTTRQTQHL